MNERTRTVGLVVAIGLLVAVVGFGVVSAFGGFG